MVAGCGAKCLKFLLFGFNLIFVIAGLVSIGIGIWLAVDDGAGSDLIELADKVNDQDINKDVLAAQDLLRAGGIILAVAGGIILLIAFLGCCGAVKEWRPLLVVYAIFLIVILCVELAAVIYVAVTKPELRKNIKKIAKKTLKEYNDNDGKTVRTFWDEVIMKEGKCCLVTADLGDFNETKSTFDGIAGKKFPDACCGKFGSDGGKATCEKSSKQFVDKGCADKLVDEFTDKMPVVIGVGVAVALIQLFGVIVALLLCKAIGDEGGSA